VDEESMKYVILCVILLCGIAHADDKDDFLKGLDLNQIKLEGRVALEAIYGRKVTFHESIGYDVTYTYFPGGSMTLTGNGKTVKGRFSDRSDGAICTTYLTLDNIMVCHKFTLQDNILTKIDMASQIGSEGRVAEGEAFAPWPHAEPTLCAKYKKIISAAQRGSFEALVNKSKGLLETTAQDIAVYESKISLSKFNCLVRLDSFSNHWCTEPLKYNDETEQEFKYVGLTGQFRACMGAEIESATYDMQDYLRSDHNYAGDVHTIREAYFRLRNNIRVHFALRNDKDCEGAKYCMRGLAVDMETSLW
jgi:hypothetical protein